MLMGMVIFQVKNFLRVSKSSVKAFPRTNYEIIYKKSTIIKMGLSNSMNFSRYVKNLFIRYKVSDISLSGNFCKII